MDHEALHSLGCGLAMEGRAAEALTVLSSAHQHNPTDPRTCHALGLQLMRAGRYLEGWPLYDARHELPSLGIVKPALPYPEWRGEPLAGKRLLIFPEQGLGDQIMYARFAVDLQQRGAEVSLLCNPALQRLFERAGVKAIAAVGAADFPEPDYWVMSGSIAGRWGLSGDNMPAAPYLSAKPTGRRRIGVAWRGNAFPNPARSLPPKLAEKLLSLDGAVSLQPEDTGAKDFLETAEMIAGLDLVISIDTSIAHLAGAMGKPVWVLLPHVADWRWMDARLDSPWYPTARLFRQRVAGEWADVADDVIIAAPSAYPACPGGGACPERLR